MFNLIRHLKRAFLDILGDIKVYRYPCFVVYDPSTFLVKGHHTREAMELLEPGDIVLRKYVHYLDGYFIPGEFSHASVYVGDGMIVHAISEDVSYIDVIDFLRCDGFCILRPKVRSLAGPAVKRAKELVGKHYDFDFVDGNDEYYCHELAVECYRSMGLEKKETRILGFRVKPRYLSTTFTESGKFDEIMRMLP